MSENLNYIDNYFKKELSPDESRAFEQRIVSDPVFAEEVAFYLDTKEVLGLQLTADKKERFRKIYEQERLLAKMTPVRKLWPHGKLWPYISAAAVAIVFITRFVFMNLTVSPLKLADEYIKENLIVLSGPMSGNTDSLQKGIQLYNDGKLNEAFQLFEQISRTDTTIIAIEAKKMSGLVYLRHNEYDKAIEYFKEVENDPLAYSNQGKFLHALALMKRNLPGDSEQAKLLLKEVVDKNLPGKKAAEKWNW